MDESKNQLTTPKIDANKELSNLILKIIFINVLPFMALIQYG